MNDLFLSVPGLQLVANRQYQDDVIGGQPTVLGNMTVFIP